MPASLDCGVIRASSPFACSTDSFGFDGTTFGKDTFKESC
jgi:hypothetical protein